MNKDIKDFIEKKAEGYKNYDPFGDDKHYSEKELSLVKSARLYAYTSGFTEGVELMKGFFIWAALNQYRIEEDELAGICWYDESVAESLLLTTDELISEYIKTIE